MSNPDPLDPDEGYDDDGFDEDVYYSLHPSMTKIEHLTSLARRRGPMDEMRQLVRILVKLIPSSASLIEYPQGGGGK